MKRLICFLLVAFVFLFGMTFVIKAEEDHSASVGESKYQEIEVADEYDLGYGVVEQRIIAESSSNLTGFNAAGSGGGGLNEPGRMYPQQVNILSVPSNLNVRIVTYVNSSNYGWGRGTVKDVIKSFEKNNPGWRVIAAVNGDFFDISGNNPLPDATSGVAVANGEVYKNVGGTNLGFTNNGEVNSIVGNQSITFTENYYLAIIDEDYEVVAEYEIDGLNPEESGDGTFVYFSYPYFINEEIKQRGYSSVEIPEGSFVVKTPERMIPFVNRYSTAYSFFGKGIAEESDVTEINYTQFAVHTTNPEIQEAIRGSYMIRVQKNLTGAYAECDNITGCGDILVENGEGVVHNNKERHPRTIVGVKADGTILMITIDGRQPGSDMYGMTLDELSAVLKAYDCVEGYNLDGGGSTTMVIRQGDKLVTLNSPSDGSERRDANALLVVVPEFSLKISDVLDSSFTISAPTKFKGIIVENIKVTIDGKEYDLIDNLEIKGIAPNTECIVSYEYDRTYNGERAHIQAEDIKVKMGQQIPIVKKLQYAYSDNKLTIYYDIDDSEHTATFATIYYSSGSIDIDVNEKMIVIDDVRSFNPDDLELTIFVEINSQTISSTFITISDFEKYEEESKKGCSKSGTYYLSVFFAMACLAFVFHKKH